jgi:hypothetical protein
LWQDSQIAPLKRIVQYVQALGSKIGIQLAHAGRKASTIPPFTEAIARDQGWKGGSTTPKEYGGWHDNGESVFCSRINTTWSALISISSVRSI